MSANSESFDGTPGVELRYTPIAVAFLAAGPGPFTLAAGQADAGPSFQPLGRLSEGAEVTGGIPTAKIMAGAPPQLALTPLPHGVSRRAWLLWAVLLLGVATLATMAWALMRGERASVQTAS